MKCIAYVLPFTLAIASCVDVGQEPVSVAMRVAGTSSEGPASAANGWSIELDRAELAFGPLYLCAGYQAGSLCDTARAEWGGSAVVNALDAEAHDVGALTGVSGSAHSWMYDLGITSLLTQQRPNVLPAAESLGGNSVRLEGVARKAAHEVPFTVELPVQQEAATEIGVCVVRKSGSDRFAHELSRNDSALTVRFDAAFWMRDVDFDELVEDASCAPGGPNVVCAGTTELTCSSEGLLDAQRDCAAEGLACIRGQGCVERVRFEPGSQGHRAVRSALVAGARPAFEWSATP